MMKTWKIKSTGKKEYILLALLLSILGYAVIVAGVTMKYGGIYEQNLIGGLFPLSLIIIAWGATFPVLINRMKIPLQITIDTENNILRFIYPRNRQSEIELSSIKFTINPTLFYSTLIFFDMSGYKHEVFQKIFALKYGFGWRISQINEISQYLIDHNIEKKENKI